MTGLFSPASLVVLAIVTAGVLRIGRTRPRVRRASLDRFARRVGLPVTEALRPRAEAALLGRNLAVDLGGATGVLLAGVVAWVADGDTVVPPEVGTAPSLWPIVVVGSALAGAAIGAAASGARQARGRADDEGPRVARASAPTYGDYVTPLELWGGRLTAVAPAALLLLGLAVAIVTDAVSLREVVSVASLLAVAVPLVALGASEVTGRRVLDLPQAAGSGLELAWRDAIRARILRDIVTAPLALGVYAVFALLLATGDSIQDEVVANGVRGLAGLATIVVLVITIVSVAERPHRHFRRRLWPEDVERPGGSTAISGSSPVGGGGGRDGGR